MEAKRNSTDLPDADASGPRTQKDKQEDMGGAGVYSLPLQALRRPPWPNPHPNPNPNPTLTQPSLAGPTESLALTPPPTPNPHPHPSPRPLPRLTGSSSVRSGWMI